MNLDQIKQIAHNAMADLKAHPDRETGYVHAHGRRTAELTMELADALCSPLDVDRDVLYAGALLHDIARDQDVHHRAGADRVRRLLSGEVGEDEMEAIARLVAEHNQRGEPGRYPLSSQLVQDADLLDHYGLQAVWLTLVRAAHGDRSQADVVADYFRRIDDHRRPRDLLNLDLSRDRFDQRWDRELAFFQRLRDQQPG